MIKVEECACGFSLRTGTLILAWLQLVGGCLKILFELLFLSLFFHREFKLYLSFGRSEVFWSIYSMIDAIVGIVVSVTAIWAIQKKNHKYLNGLYWYFCYSVIFIAYKGISSIHDPVMAVPPLTIYISTIVSQLQMSIVAAVYYLFVIAFASYFTLVVKSYGYYAVQNEAQIKVPIQLYPI